MTDHPLRYTLVNELHARPFPVLSVPSTAAFIALMEEDGAARDKARDRAHLLALLDRHASSHPQPEATHFSGPIGRSELKWESHTEFVTYTAFTPGLSARPFDPTDSSSFSPEWRDKAAGRVAASVLVRIEEHPGSDEAMMTKLESWFVDVTSRALIRPSMDMAR